MRIMDYLSSGAVLIIAFAVILFVAGVVISVLDAAGIEVGLDVDTYRWVMYIAGGAFIVAVIFDYVYGIIVGEE